MSVVRRPSRDCDKRKPVAMRGGHVKVLCAGLTPKRSPRRTPVFTLSALGSQLESGGDGRERSRMARCPHLRGEIWGTQFLGVCQMWATRPTYSL